MEISLKVVATRNREEIIRLLRERKYDELIKLSRSKKRVLNILISLTYDKNNIICWLSIEAIGLITKDISRTKPDIVRNIIGRLLWMIRDKSGGIGWSSPEILGEIVRNNPELFPDIALIIVSFLDEEKLSAGVLWAIGRIGEVSPMLVGHAIPIMLPYLHNQDKILRGLAVWALGQTRAFQSLKEIEKLKNDNECITFYDNGEFREKTIGELAKEAIEKISTGVV